MSGRTRWLRVSRLFDGAVELDPSCRAGWLARECAGDPGLQAEVERLLRADASAARLDAGAPAAALEGPDPGLHVGERFGPYRIESVLGHGGMGVVYRARREDADFDQVVALKLVRPGLCDAGARRRFLEERRLLARLDHPNIARLLDGGLGPGGQPWFAMAYIDGEKLTTWCDRHLRSVDERLQLFAKVCDVVDHAHRQLVVHRDLKPDNILIDVRGEPHLLDFGIARLLCSDGAGIQGGTTRMMTPEYAAPEQLCGETAGTATDVYALGVMLYELLTGRRPFAGPLSPRDPPAAARAWTDDDAGHRAGCRRATPRQMRRRLAGDLERVLRAALDPVASRRYASAAALAADLRACCSRRPISLRSDRAYRAGRFMSRNRWATALAAAAMLVLHASLAFALWQAREARQQADQATRTRDFVVQLFSLANPMQSPDGSPPTAAELLETAARRIEGDLGADPRTQAELRIAMARNLRDLGELGAALPLFERGVAQLRAWPDARRQLAEALDARASARRTAGDVAGAELDALEALGLFEQLPGDHAAARISLRTLLANLVADRGDEHGALELHRLILRDRSALLGEDHPDTAVDWNNLAAAALALGSYAEAERGFSHATDLLRRRHGDRHPRLAWTRIGRGAALHGLARHAEADAELDAAQALLDAMQEANPPMRMVLLNARGVGLRQQGRHDEAAVLFGQALALAPEVQGKRRAVIEGNLGLNALAQGRHAQARGWLETAARRLEETQATPSRFRHRIEGALGAAMAHLGEVEQGEQRMRTALEALAASHGIASEAYVEIAGHLARLHEQIANETSTARHQ